jgi:hypothetical protein
MSPIEEVRLDPLKRQFPHVESIEDWRAQQSIRLLWDRVFDLEGRLQAAEATLTRLVAASNTQEAQIHEAQRTAEQAVAELLATRAETDAAASAGGKDDQGKGAAGCAAPYSTGHPPAPLTADQKTVENAGKIVCGVALEFPTLMAATATKALRDTNRAELMERMIWHLNQAGFPCDHFPGTGSEAEYCLLFDALALDGTAPVREYGYRVTDYDPGGPTFSPWDTTNVMTTCMECTGQEPGTTTTPAPGTPD